MPLACSPSGVIREPTTAERAVMKHGEGTMRLWLRSVYYLQLINFHTELVQWGAVEASLMLQCEL